jgi:hypothetical protein
MISMDKTYRTRDGREVRIYATDGDGSHPVHGAIKINTGWRSCTWEQEGFHLVDKGYCDLIEVKPRIKRTVWIALYPNDVAWFSGENMTVGKDCLARGKVEIDFEKGEGL